MELAIRIQIEELPEAPVTDGSIVLVSGIPVFRSQPPVKNPSQ